MDTTVRLESLRKKLKDLELDAFLVPSGDSHQSEYVAPADKRRHWIGGFSGSSGFAVVTLSKAAMWTDGRYVLHSDIFRGLIWSSTNFITTGIFFKQKINWIVIGYL